MTSADIDVLSIVQSWLAANEAKILSFWVGADWRAWARFELFMALEQALEKDCLVTHSNDDFWSKSTDMIDVLVEPHNSDSRAVAIILRCEKVNDNEGSFETFAEQYDSDWARIQSLGTDTQGFEGSQVMLLGFSGEPVGEGIDVFRTNPKPAGFVSGNVNGWVTKLDLPRSAG